MNKHDFTLKTITPVHIGSGDEYGSLEYIESKAKTKNDKKIGIFKRIDIEKYYSSLDEDKRDEFIANLTDGAFRLGDYDRKIKFNKYIAYDKCKQKPSSNQEIQENVRSSNEFFIPGSSIKGAIKTALLYNSINEDNIPDIVNSLIKGNSVDGREYADFMKKIFSSYKGNAAQTSIMRFMIVADSSSIKNPSIYDVISVMANERGRNQYYSRGGNIVRSFIETIDRNWKLKSSITLNHDSNILNRLNLNDKERLLDLNYIKRSIYNFSKDYINHELEFSEEYDISYLNKFYKKIEKINTPETPLLKIGAGSGFLATTINLKVKNYDYAWGTDYYNEVRETLRHTYAFEFPKSRKIFPAIGQPLGWTQLNFD